MNIQRTLLPLLVLSVATAFGAVGCKSAPSGRPSNVAAPEPLSATTSLPPLPDPVRLAPPPSAPTGNTSDRGDRLLPPRPIGALAPEIAPTVPDK